MCEGDDRITGAEMDVSGFVTWICGRDVRAFFPEDDQRPYITPRQADMFVPSDGLDALRVQQWGRLRAPIGA